MNAPPTQALKAQAAMERQMRIQSLGATGYVLIKDIFNAIELPPDLESRVLAIMEFVEAEK